ncbi:MAG: lipopolysaccharide biosynthesis protein [Lachnospiraceae bacterium]|nr:lipopolysaccharide biosynthesis protein [Lachnospiraceae bacterium]
MKTWITESLWKETNHQKENGYKWYALGSTLFALSTLVTTIIVTRFTDESTGGMFSIGLSLAQWMSTIAYFEIRTFQVTDVKREYKLSQYVQMRFLTCIAAFCAAIAIIAFSDYTILKAQIVGLLCFYKICEGVSDVYEGEYQRSNRIDISGKSMFFRTLICTAALILGILITKNIIWSLVVMDMLEIVAIYYLDIVPTRMLDKKKSEIEKNSLLQLVSSCIPLATCNFLNTYLINSSKFSVDRMLGDRMQIYYSAVFMPNFVINLFCGIVLRPIETKLAIYYVENKKRELIITVSRLCGIIMIFTLVCIIGAYLIGIPILSLLYGIDLSECKLVLIVLLFAGGINAISVVFYYVITIMRKQKYMFAIYALTTVFSLMLLDRCVETKGLMGAATGYLAILLFLCLLLFILMICKKKYNRCG